MRYDYVPRKVTEQIEAEKIRIRHLTDRDFEYYIADMFKKLGYDTEVTPASNDGGKDIVLIKSGKRYYVECKHFAECDLVGRPVIQKAFGAAMADYVNGCFIVTSSTFNSNALEEAAKRNLIYTMDIDDIAYINILPDGFIAEAFNCQDEDKYSKLKDQYIKSLRKLSENDNKHSDSSIVSENIIAETEVNEVTMKDANTNTKILAIRRFLKQVFGHCSRITKIVLWQRLLAGYGVIFVLALVCKICEVDIHPVLGYPIVLYYYWWGFDSIIARLHDLNESGWKWLYLGIPGLNILYLYKLFFKSGVMEDNQYGDSPYDLKKLDLEKLDLERKAKERQYDELNRKYETEKNEAARQAKAKALRETNGDLKIYYDEGNCLWNEALLFRDEGYIELRPVYKNMIERIMLKDITSVEFKFSAYTQTDIDEGSSGIGEAALGYAVGGWKGAAAGYYLGSSDDEISTSDKWSMLLIVETVNKDNPVYVFANEVVTETDCNNYKRMYALLKHYAKQ